MFEIHVDGTVILKLAGEEVHLRISPGLNEEISCFCSPKPKFLSFPVHSSCSQHDHIVTLRLGT